LLESALGSLDTYEDDYFINLLTKNYLLGKKGELTSFLIMIFGVDIASELLKLNVLMEEEENKPIHILMLMGQDINEYRFKLNKFRKYRSYGIQITLFGVSYTPRMPTSEESESGEKFFERRASRQEARKSKEQHRVEQYDRLAYYLKLKNRLLLLSKNKDKKPKTLQEARDIYNKLVIRSPDDPQIHQIMWEVLMKFGLTDEANEIYERMLECIHGEE
jgi:tetratricopeptide (TPR) repeat protein